MAYSTERMSQCWSRPLCSDSNVPAGDHESAGFGEANIVLTDHPSDWQNAAPRRYSEMSFFRFQAFLAHANREELACATVIRDLDGKYTADFDRLFTGRGITMKPVGPRAPNLNAFVERWIQSVKHEALNHFVVFGLEHFDHIVREFVDYYHDHRPHQGIGNRLIREPPSAAPPPIESVEQLACESRLGGLLKSYSRAA